MNGNRPKRPTEIKKASEIKKKTCLFPEGAREGRYEDRDGERYAKSTNRQKILKADTDRCRTAPVTQNKGRKVGGNNQDPFRRIFK